MVPCIQDRGQSSSLYKGQQILDLFCSQICLEQFLVYEYRKCMLKSRITHAMKSQSIKPESPDWFRGNLKETGGRTGGLGAQYDPCVSLQICSEGSQMTGERVMWYNISVTFPICGWVLLSWLLCFNAISEYEFVFSQFRLISPTWTSFSHVN